MKSIGSGLTLVLSLLLTSCTSFYSSSALGHDLLFVPTLPRSESTISTNLSVVAKVSPVFSLFTNDSTKTGQLGLSVQNAVKMSDFSRITFENTGSGYFSQTSIFLARVGATNTASNQVEHQVTGYGFVGQSKLGLIFDTAPNSFEVGLFGAFNREYGDYLKLRSNLSTLTNEKTDRIFDTQRVDMSPRGTSLEFGPYFQTQWNQNQNESVIVGYRLGAALPNWPESNNYIIANSFTVSYRLKRLWWSAAVETLGALNVGMGFSFGTFLN